MDGNGMPTLSSSANVSVVQSLPPSVTIPSTAGHHKDSPKLGVTLSPNTRPQSSPLRPGLETAANGEGSAKEEEEQKDLSDMPTLILGESAVGPTDVDIRKLFLQEVLSSQTRSHCNRKASECPGQCP